ncbi:MAG: sigma-70 family RNA polymerase sigma factor [Bacilli bacterium]|nr:sigma-70 family RNA polymerase sigma factor [Bacilli bacterium]MDD4733501.1 sigma-70 family RNA polymerase sigma factor [Bacilli bacterium]
MDYKTLNDFELIYYAKENDEDANELLYAKYKPLIVSMAAKMFKYTNQCGIEINDLIQEGMLGFSYAINSFNEEKNVTFYTYATTCVERKIISAITKANRQKNKILNESLPIEINSDDDQEKQFDKLLSDNSYNPENIIVGDEFQMELLEIANRILTDYEYKVFELKINQFSYIEIAQILEKTPKAIDNALQRIKFKIKRALEHDS